MPDAAGIIGDLGLKPNPEGGAYGETFRDAACLGSGTKARGASTAIYFLLQPGERSHWHRVDAAAAWHWYAGAPLRLMVSAGGRQMGRASRRARVCQYVWISVVPRSLNKTPAKAVDPDTENE